nr:MAG TPA: hypothetical protein [Bacteriophage sp.]
MFFSIYIIYCLTVLTEYLWNYRSSQIFSYKSINMLLY